jgi:dTDP-4-dehydrorhamnose 3,5-epimerase
VEIKRFEIEGPVELVSTRFSDDRGYFSETFNISNLMSIGISIPAWVQDNQSFSENIYTLRGLHFQREPFAQAKLVRVLKGEIFDVAVDIRPDSPNFGKWIGTTLTADRMNQLYVPAGFAHGFMTLEPKVEVFYKVSASYSKQHDRSLNWKDAMLAIDWPLPKNATPYLSDKDSKAPNLVELKNQI